MLTIILSLLALHSPTATPYCPHPKRDRAQVIRFERLTGYPHGRPGYVVDHKIPLCACGKDAPSNMQWMRADSAKAKDAREKALCRRLAAHAGR